MKKNYQEHNYINYNKLPIEPIPGKDLDMPLI